MSSKIVVFDARCLQDANYASRGVGRHALGLLRGRPPCTDRIRLIGLVDPSMPALSRDARAAFEVLSINAYAAAPSGDFNDDPVAFVSLSPMTHDPLFCARLLSNSSLLRVAVVYDFIPRRHPERYLPRPADRLDYAVQLRWLANCELFCAISHSTADDLNTILGVPQDAVVVTGASVEPAFERAANMAGVRSHILVVGGGDPRKNPETVIRAHASSALLQQKGTKLVVAGNYGPVQASEFCALAIAFGGRADLLTIPGHASEEELLKLYAGASVLVCASHDEGFSLPVVEGMAAGAVVLVSDIPAHVELVADPARRFPSNDYKALSLLLERVVTKRALRQRALQEQATVWPHFLTAEVARRFWTPLLTRLDGREAAQVLAQPAVLRGRRPRVAILSPLPPDRSGVADYTAATCFDLGSLVELHAFTETAGFSPLRGTVTVRPLDALPHMMPQFDRVVSVLGNSHFHLRIFELMQSYGGAVIAHDARMLSFYRVLLGKERALAQASRELNRPVSEKELDGWMEDESTLKTLFLGEIADSAKPMVVHSHVTSTFMRERHGIAAAYVPFSIYRPWRPEELSPASRAAARARLGFPADEVVIATFGYVHANKGPEECIWALEFLRAWGVRASLHFVGGTENMLNNGELLRKLAVKLGVAEHIHILGSFVSEQVYKDYLAAADLAIQLRTYGLGGLSGALLDCAAAGLPCVTNVSLGNAVGVPSSYTRNVPDLLNPILLAEAARELIDAGVTVTREETERHAYSEARSFKVYARELCNALHLDLSTPGSSLRHKVTTS